MKSRLIFLGILLCINSISAQIVYEPMDKDVYSFLERLSQKGIIEVDNLVKPLSKKYIADKLIEAKNKIELLTSLEKDELIFFEKDYFFEIQGFDENNTDKKSLSYFEGDGVERFRFYSYSDKTFKLTANPLIGFNFTYPDRNRIVHSWMGISSYAYLVNSIGISLNFRTNNEKGEGIDIKKNFTPETGIIPEVHDTGKDIAYSEVNSTMSADWGWGNAVIAKDHIEYGYAKFGNLVLSNKAPSFPYIRLDIKPVDWFKFYYFHAWLSSNVIDSVNLAAYKRNIFIDKYFAWHAMIVTPMEGLDISLGESVVYSDKLEIVYLIPFMFYYLADEFISNRQNKPGDANQQIFITLSSKNHLKNTHVYGTLFIDELTIAGVNGSLFINPNDVGFDSKRKRTQLGYTVGLSVTDLPIENLTLTSEYTRINPYVYGHHDPAQTYENSSYLMGHWMGHNSDLFYLNLNYRFLRGFQADVWGSYIRKGSSSYDGQYASTQPEFLFGLKNYYKYFGINLKYELIHELNFETKFKLTNISTEQEDGSFKDNQTNEFSFSFYYGF
jgi:hypothetical protein